VLGHKSRCFPLWINFNLSSKLKNIDLLKKRIRRIERERERERGENNIKKIHQKLHNSHHKKATKDKK